MEYSTIQMNERGETAMLRIRWAKGDVYWMKCPRCSNGGPPVYMVKGSREEPYRCTRCGYELK